MKRFFLVAFSLMFLFSSCKNDLDVNGPWKETMIIYGLLNPADSIQYVKINKAFLNEGADVKTVAKIADSIFYDTLSVKLIREQDGKVFELKRDDKLAKQPGYFADDRNTLYFTKTPMNAGESYRLEVVNPKTGYKAESRTELVGAPTLFSPVTTFSPGVNINPTRLISFNFLTGKNAAAYDVKVVFVYDEISVADTNIKTRKQATWNIITDLRPSSTDGNERLRTTVPGLGFYQFVAGAVKPNPAVKRRAIFINFEFYAGTRQLVDYISVNEPSIGIIQKQAEYTNITNGYGIFSGRHVQRFNNVKPDDETRALLRTDPNTANLGFIP